MMGAFPWCQAPSILKSLYQGAGFIIDRYGFGNSRFVTKEIKLPPNWAELVKDLSGWETPIEVH